MRTSGGPLRFRFTLVGLMTKTKKVAQYQHRGLLSRRTQELKALVQVAQLVNVIDLDYVLTQTLQVITEAVRATKGSFFLLDAAGEPIQRFITQRNMPPEVSRQVARQVIQQGLAGWCIRNKKGTVVDDIQTDPRWLVFPDDDQTDVRSALCVPVLYDQEPQGVITLVSPEVAHFDELDLEVTSAIASQASTAIRNAQLFDSLKTQQQQLELILQSTSEALLTVNTNLVIIQDNHQARNLLIEPPIGSLVDKSLKELEPTSIYPEIANRIQAAEAGTHAFSFELRDEVQNRDFVISVSALLGGRESAARGYVITIIDISSLREYDRLKTHMLHMLTHDLKNPLNIIWGYLDLLRIDSQQKLPADPRFVDGILRALHRMENMIEETLSAERMMSIGQQKPYRYFAPEPIIHEAIDSLQELADKKALEIIKDIQPNLAEIFGDPFQLRETMTNLISNAIKYTPEAGMVMIHADCDETRFNFFVRDNGMGIPEELQGQLFSRFYRALRPATKDIAGTGLGLSLVKNAVERHRGQVWFESREGEGSTFGFWIPLARSSTSG